MSNIIDYSYLISLMTGSNNNNSGMTRYGTFQLNNIGNKNIQAQLKAAGIDTNSAQYKATIKNMTKNGNGIAYTNIQAIKNCMKEFDADGDRISPVSGLAGLEVNAKTIANKRRIISIPESSREEMFELTKKEYLQENGVANGDTTHRTDVYYNLYRKMEKKDRLAAGNTLDKYERAYTQACFDAVKSVKPDWEIGQKIPDGALDNLNREEIESKMNLKSEAVDIKI